MPDRPEGPSDHAQDSAPQQFRGPAPTAAGYVPRGPRAGFWKRFVALLVDSILLGGVGIFVGRIFGQEVVQVEDTTVRYSLSGLPFVVTTLIQAAYLISLEGSNAGQTLGKKLLGIRVIGLDSGVSIGHGRAAIRWIGRYLSGFVLLLGYLWMLWDKEKQTWHDKFASSIVVETSAYPVD